MRELCSSIISALVFRSLFAFFVFQFGIVGATLGAIAGAVIGWNNKMRFMQNVVKGIVSGTILSYKLIKATFNYLNSDHDDTNEFAGFVVHLVKIITRDLEGRLRCDDQHKIMRFNKKTSTFGEVYTSEEFIKLIIEA